MSEPDNFGGAWLVAEYVHDPDGTFIGIVKQRRLVEPVDAGRLRITQICEPEPTLSTHPMAAFAGTWVFDLTVDGPTRTYLGPDVVGQGTEWRPGALTATGTWPRFGHDFSSYSVLVAPDRQLTGGFFSIAGRSVADIVGVAVPESLGIEPSLDLAADPPDPGTGWLLSRAVGPMTVATDRPAPDRVRRLVAVTDRTSDSTVRITEEHRADTALSVEISS